jgi:hypothetical protein
LIRRAGQAFFLSLPERLFLCKTKLPMVQRYLPAFLLLFCFGDLQAQVASDYAVQLSVSTQLSPAQIRLQWTKLSGATGYSVSRKRKTDVSFSPIASLTAADSTYTDVSVVADSAYEYQVVKTGSVVATGYVLAAIQAQPIHNRGYCILMVDSAFRDSCRNEIAQLMADLRGDGWGVIRHDAGRSASVASIRSMIQADYAAYTNVRSLLLLGHIPVAYSGDINPDGHPDHLGAWPTDGYYADVDGVWTDVSVNDTAASRTQNRNKPADGKWDQIALPSAEELQTGRIDFANMPAMSRTEVQMMRAYLNKAHSYKMDSLSVMRKAVVDDNFGAFSGEAFAANAWRIFPVMVGRGNVLANDFETTLKDSAYQWAYGCGAGSYNSCNGVGVTSDFNTKPVKGIFTMTFGSYFGDWDAQNDFLRAPLCAPEPALTNCWAGRPNWFLHQMALGESIGYCALLSQNNNSIYGPTNYGAGWIHTSLMGDPSLRTDYIRQPKGLTVSPVPNAGANLSWTAAPDPNVAGYYVYRSDSAWGTYVRISGMITASTFTDGSGVNGKKYYLVRPAKLVQTPSGGYYNLGVGIVDSASVTYPLSVASAAAATGVTLFPSPAAKELKALIECGERTDALIALSDITGSVLKQENITLHPGTNTIGWNVSGLPAGIYLFALRTRDAAITRKWIKQ